MSGKIHDLPRRFPGMTEEEGGRLVAEVEESGTARFTHGGQTWQLKPSPVEGSRAVWAAKVDAEPPRRIGGEARETGRDRQHGTCPEHGEQCPYVTGELEPGA